jgi:WD40 repeat protein/phage FluMu protein Com
MPRQFRCPSCQVGCAVPEGAVGRKVRCPRCQTVFATEADTPPEVLPADEAMVADPPPRRSRSEPLIPARKQSRSGGLIPPPPGGKSIKASPSFAEREVRGAIVWVIVMGISALVMGGAIAGFLWWTARKELAPLPPPSAQKQTSQATVVAPVPPDNPGVAPKDQAVPGPPEDLFVPVPPQAGEPVAANKPDKPKPEKPKAEKPKRDKPRPEKGNELLKPRDHGPAPAFEEWTVVDEQKLEHKDGIWNAAVSPDGKLLATAANTHLRLWDIEANPPREKTNIRMPVRSSNAMRFFPDGKTLALALPDNSLRLYDVAGEKISERLVMKDWAGRVFSLNFSPDGKTMVVGADDMTVWLYDITGEKPKEKKVFRVQKTGLGIKGVFFSPDGKRLVLGTGAGAVRLWDVEVKEPQEIAGVQGRTESFKIPMSLSPDGQVLAVARGKQVHLMDVLPEGFAEWMVLAGRHNGTLWSAAFSPDGKLLATTGADGQIVLWKVGLDRPILVKQRPKTYSEVLFVPGGKSVRVVACNWNTGTIYLFTVAPQSAAAK